MSRLRNLVMLLRGQLWLVPAFVCVCALALAYGMLVFGPEWLPGEDGRVAWIYGGDAGSARELLSSLLSGLITMTSLVISITFVILTLAANQLGPRLIATFIADRQIQAVIGVFLGTILYLLVVLRTLDDALGPQGVPHVAVTVGSGLTVLCLFTLLLYLSKVARAVIADNVVVQVADELQANVVKILPERGPGGTGEAPTPWPPGAVPLALGGEGYVQTIDYGALVDLAKRRDLSLRVRVKAGDFVLRQGEHVDVDPPGRLDARAAAAIRGAFVVGRERTAAQDLEHGIRQLVEIGVRALSSGINDPFTAIAVVDRIGAAIEVILSRAPAPAEFFDGAGRVRVVVVRPDLDGIVAAAFDGLRRAAGAHPEVLGRIAEVIGQLEAAATAGAARSALALQLRKLDEMARHAPLMPSDRDEIVARIAIVRAAFARSAGAGDPPGPRPPGSRDLQAQTAAAAARPPPAASSPHQRGQRGGQRRQHGDDQRAHEDGDHRGQH